MSHDGRVIAKDPGMSPGKTFHDGDETSIHLQMIRNHDLHVCLVVSGSILPAWDVLLLEHRLREADFTSLARKSPIVPTGRETLRQSALRGLRPGFRRDSSYPGATNRTHGAFSPEASGSKDDLGSQRNRNRKQFECTHRPFRNRKDIWRKRELRDSGAVLRTCRAESAE